MGRALGKHRVTTRRSKFATQISKMTCEVNDRGGIVISRLIASFPAVRIMRKRIAVSIGLIVVMLAIVGPALVTHSVRASELPLRVGMTPREAWDVLELRGIRGPVIVNPERPELEFVLETDWLGGRCAVVVYFNDEPRITRWETVHLPRARPPWLDKALKWTNW
jgi:hypothetical protein